MHIHDIKITNFRSCYGEHYFNFDDIKGLIKLSGPIGAGKTTLGEAIIWGLFGSVKEHNNPNLVSWNTNFCQVEMNITSKNKRIYIRRNIREQLYATVDDKLISASNKKDYQNILEEFYDVPKLAIEKMCIISFNTFNTSIASMTPYETKIFLDEIFGFKTFSEYNDKIVQERKNQIAENTKLNALYEDTNKQIEYLEEKKSKQQAEISNNIDIESLNRERQSLIDNGLKLKEKQANIEKDYNEKINEQKSNKMSHYNNKMEYATLGKQEKEYYNTFKTGICPTCGHSVDINEVEKRKLKMQEYATLYKEEDKVEKEYDELISELERNKNNDISSIKNEMDNLRKQISEIDSKIKTYNNSLKLIGENYDELISDYKQKLEELNKNILVSDAEIGEWNEMNELFSKTLRYNLLDTLIPHINSSIQFYINKLEQNYIVKFDQEFKAHIYTDFNPDNEISYKDLSTGQRKTLDVAIIFGILQNIIANVKCNVIFLDELMSNMDSDSRNTLLGILKDTLKDKTVFVVNHAEMMDDFFDHKYRVYLVNKKIISSSKYNKSSNKDKEVIVKNSKFELVF